MKTRGSIFLKFVAVTTLLCAVVTTTSARKRNINYDESKIVPYTLPDPLTCNDGTKVSTVEQWEKQRRPEILQLLSKEIYGETPKARLKARYKVIAENRKAALSYIFHQTLDTTSRATIAPQMTNGLSTRHISTV